MKVKQIKKRKVVKKLSKVRLWISKQHTSPKNPKPHTDSYRQVQGGKTEKTGHNFNSPGYRGRSVKIPIKRS